MQSTTVPAVPPLGPNLIVTNVSAPSQVIADPATLQVSWSVANVGDVAINSRTWRDLVILSTDDLFGNADDFIAAEFTRSSNLAISQSYTRTETVTLPPGFEGEFKVGVRTDGSNEIYESTNEGDNSSSSSGLTT
ncbi:MAG: CARDB domain-containing protein, partial [Pirellula staleyi]